MQVVAVPCPVTALYLPTGQLVQEPLAPYLPASHAVQELATIAPVPTDLVPGGQEKQSASWSAPVAELYLPVPQSVQSLSWSAPAAAPYLPVGQKMQLVVSTADMPVEPLAYLPAAHMMHEACAAVF